MNFLIYSAAKEAAEKKLVTLNRRAERAGAEGVKWTWGEEVVETVRASSTDGHTLYCEGTETVKAVKLSVTAPDIISADGWEVVAQIDHREGGNIINSRGEEFGAEWYTAKPHCECCHSKRDRLRTYIVRHRGGELKQVGSSCLREYTGISPAALIWGFEVKDILLDDLCETGWETWGASCRVYKVSDIIAWAVQSVTEHGYIRSTEMHSTREDVFDRMGHDVPITDSDRETARLVVEWLRTTPEEVGLLRDLSTICAGEYCGSRDVGRLCYAPVAYRKAMDKRAVVAKQVAASHHVGEVGQRLRFSVKNCSIVTSSAYSYGGGWGVSVSVLVKMTTTEDNVLVWWTTADVETLTNATEEHPVCIVGTIKNHDNYNGVAQTQVTRVKVKEEK